MLARYCLVALIALAALSAGCGSGVYTHTGFTQADTFHIPPAALGNQSPNAQSWIAYSLGLSTCQISFGGEQPAQHQSFECELRARRILAERWDELASFTAHKNRYLDTLVAVHQAGYLNEYVWTYHRERDWNRPSQLDLDRFDKWRAKRIGKHRPQTRMIGYWVQTAR